MAFPKMARVRQHFDAPILTDLPAAIHVEFDRIDAASVIRSGDAVAITAGSRGVANIATAVKATVDYLKRSRCEPFCRASYGEPWRRNSRRTTERIGTLRYYRNHHWRACESNNGGRGTR